MSRPAYLVRGALARLFNVAHLRIIALRPVSLLGTSGNGLERRLFAFLDPLLSCAALVVEAHNGPIPGGRFPTGITSVVSEGNNEVGDYLVAALRGEPRLITYVRGWSSVLDLSSLREAGYRYGLPRRHCHSETCRVSHRIFPDPARADLIRQVFELYASGTKSLKEVTRRAAKRG